MRKQQQRRKALFFLAVAVVLAHGLLIWRLPDWRRASRVADSGELVMQTRMLAPEPEPEPEPVPPAPPPVPRRTPPKSEPPKPARPVPRPESPQPPAPAPAPPEPMAPAAAPEQPEPESEPAGQPEPGGEARGDAPGQTGLGQQIVPANGPAQPPGTPVAVAIAAPVKLEFEARGQVKGFNYSAEAGLLWRHDGERYTLTQSISMFLMGTRSQTSEGRITDIGLAPERFIDRGRKEQSARFDIAEGKAHYSGGTPDAAISLGVQDRVSVFMQLSALIAAAPDRYPEGTVIALTTSSARHAARWRFQVMGTESLRLPAGAMPALRLQKLPDAEASGNDTQAMLWLGTGFDYLPVRIRLTQGESDYVDLRLKSYGIP